MREELFVWAILPWDVSCCLWKDLESAIRSSYCFSIDYSENSTTQLNYLAWQILHSWHIPDGCYFKGCARKGSTFTNLFHRKKSYSKRRRGKMSCHDNHLHHHHWLQLVKTQRKRVVWSTQSCVRLGRGCLPRKRTRRPSKVVCHTQLWAALGRRGEVEKADFGLVGHGVCAHGAQQSDEKLCMWLHLSGLEDVVMFSDSAPNHASRYAVHDHHLRERVFILQPTLRSQLGAFSNKNAPTTIMMVVTIHWWPNDHSLIISRGSDAELLLSIWKASSEYIASVSWWAYPKGFRSK